MGNNKVCDFVGCNDEATDIIDCENVLYSFSVYMCLQHYQYFVSDQSLDNPIDLKPIDGQVHQVIHHSGGLLTKIKIANKSLN